MSTVFSHAEDPDVTALHLPTKRTVRILSAAVLVSCTSLAACSNNDDPSSSDATFTTAESENSSPSPESDDTTNADETSDKEETDHTCNSSTLELEQIENGDGDPVFNIPIPEGWETFDTGGGPDDGSYYPEIGFIDRDEASQGETTMLMFSAQKSSTGGEDGLEEFVTDGDLRVTESTEPTTTCGYPAQAFTGIAESDLAASLPDTRTHLHVISIPVEDGYVVASLSVVNADATTSGATEGLDDSALDYDQELFDQVVDGIQIATPD